MHPIPVIKLAITLALSTLSIVFAYAGNARSTNDIADGTGFSIKVTVEPVFPLRLKNEGYTYGNAILQIVVDQHGELRDALILEATHPEFGNSVIDVIDTWDFGVPMINGEAVAVTQKVQVNFEASGTVLSYVIGGDIMLNSLFRNLDHMKSSYKIASANELDSIPLPIHIEKPIFPTEMLKGKTAQHAVFEFFIDQAGNVRIPTLRENEFAEKIDEQLLTIAQNALMQWKFETPTRDGHPVVVRVAQPITFSNPSEVAVAP